MIAYVELSPPKPERAIRTAKAFLEDWNREDVWVDEYNNGLFELSSSGDSGSIVEFDELVELIGDFDSSLSPADCRAAAAMIFHLAPTMTYDDQD